jgi:excisionase family DNA binding protein
MTATPIPLFGDETPPESAAGERRRRRPGAPPAPPIPREPDRLLTAVEAAAVLGIGRSKLYELMARGAITSVKVDRCRRFRQSDVHRYINSLPETTG